MTNVTEETEALGRQLWALYTEALGILDEVEKTWEDLTPYEREAWVQVAQYIVDHYGNQEPDHK